MMEMLHKVRRVLKDHWNTFSYLLAGLVLVVLSLSHLDDQHPKVSTAAGIALGLATLWVTTPIPVGVTAMLPLVLYPILGIMDGKSVAKCYFSDTHFVFVGSFFLAIAVERVNLHRRIALNLLLLLGVKPKNLLFGFSFSTFLLSTCLSNTATAIMVIPLAMAVVDQLERPRETQAALGDVDDHVVDSSSSADVRGVLQDESSFHVDPSDGKEAAELDRGSLLATSARQANGDEGMHSRDQLLTSSGTESDNFRLLQAQGDQSTHRDEEEEPGPRRRTSSIVVAALQGIRRVVASALRRRAHKSPLAVRLRRTLALGVAYSANIGGVATLIGTPPNLVYAGQFPILFPRGPPVSFSNWFYFSAPYSLLMFLLCFFVLSLTLRHEHSDAGDAQEKEMVSLEAAVLTKERNSLGEMRREEIVVILHGILLVILWFTRTPGILSVGWSQLFAAPSYITDGTAAMLISLSLFLFPKDIGKSDTARDDEATSSPSSRRILDADAIKDIPWSVVILLGGGFALAEGSKASGLSSWMAKSLMSLHELEPEIVLLTTILLASLMTECNSNVAATAMLLPIVAELSVGLEVSPMAHMICVTFACSFAFMLPISTPPNAIAFATNAVSARDMLKVGFFLNTIACLTLTVYTMLFFKPVYGHDPFQLPWWAADVEDDDRRRALEP
mmetsp:Transcript_16113/g.36840  ORF Transcript_16113/g.36840 Transcript_16113/m.36840 type:complete len:674 (-) Transcript_16113:57-2078(-)